MVLRAVVGANSGGGSGTGSFATTTGQPTDNTALASLFNTYAKLASPTFTGTPRGPTAVAASNDTTLANTAFVKTAIAAIVSSGNATWGSVTGTLSNQTDLVNALAAKQNSLPVGNASQYIRGDATLGTLSPGSVGLPNVNNTADADKPLSTAAQTALNQKAAINSPTFQGTPTTPTPAQSSNDNTVINSAWVTTKLAGFTGGGGGMANPMTTSGDMIIGGTNGAPARLPAGAAGTRLAPGGQWTQVTKQEVGLGNADNTPDSAKPVSSAQAAALAGKAPLVSPAFDGTPTGPTAAVGTTNNQLATTSFVASAVSGITSNSGETATFAEMVAVATYLKSATYFMSLE